MAFGKVFIRTASGETDEYTLTKPSTTIGRQPGNDIVLNTSTASRYHARIDVANGGVFLVDLESAAGTFVNDVQVEPGGSVPLSQGDTISIGDVLLIYTSPQARGRLDIALAPTPAAVERRGVPFVMVLDEPQQLVAPGARLQLILVVENLADRPLDFNISTSGIDETWLRIDRRALRLDSGEQAHVVITVLPPRSSDTRPGRYALTVRVALAEDPNVALEAVREIDVVGYSGLALDARRGEEPGTYYIAARNEGNVPLDIELGGYMRGRRLTFDFDPPEMVLGPGETGHAALVVEPVGRKRRNEPLEFAIVARSRDAAGFYAPLRVVYTPERRGITFPAFVALVLLAGVLFTAVLAAGAWAFGLWPFDGLQ
ncbi:MAG: FHA domain-containing protein, partial [Chloroflexi bacterium]|nr:FHA domain-containing protein [Chloroflexota bacterium]